MSNTRAENSTSKAHWETTKSLDHLIDDVIMGETRFPPLVREMKEKSGVSAMEVTKKVTVDSSAIGL